MDANMEKDCVILEEFFQQIVLDMKNSFPIWEDFTVKAGRLHTALRTTAVCTSAFLESFQKLADMALGTRGSTREIGSALTRLCLRHRSIDSKLKTFTSGIAELLVAPLQERMDDWKRTLATLDRDHARENKKVHQEIRRASGELTRLQKKAKKGKPEVNEQLEQAVRDVNERLATLHELERHSVRNALVEQRARLCLFVSGLKPVMDEELSILSEMSHVQEIVHSLCMVANEPDVLPTATEHLIADMLTCDDAAQQRQQIVASLPTPSSPGSTESRLSSADSFGSVIDGGGGHSGGTAGVGVTTGSGTGAGSQSPTLHYQRSLSMPNPGYAVYSSSTLPADTADSCAAYTSYSASSPASDSVAACTSDPQQSVDIEQTATKQNLEFTERLPEAGPLTAAGMRFSTLPASMDHRPHTISSAYERTGHARPALSADMFSPMGSRSRPPSVHGMSGISGSTTGNSGSPYAVPCVAPPARRREAGGAKVADIYARPSLVGARSGGVRALPVATPTVPDFMSIAGAGPTSPPSDVATNASAFPVAGYVNMNQLAHMALQHQGLQCLGDKKEQPEQSGYSMDAAQQAVGVVQGSGIQQGHSQGQGYPMQQGPVTQQGYPMGSQGPGMQQGYTHQSQQGSERQHEAGTVVYRHPSMLQMQGNEQFVGRDYIEPIDVVGHQHKHQQQQQHIHHSQQQQQQQHVHHHQLQQQHQQQQQQHIHHHHQQQQQQHHHRGQQQFSSDPATFDSRELAARLEMACRLQPVNGYCTLPRRPRGDGSRNGTQSWLSLSAADIASMYTSGKQPASHVQYAESAHYLTGSMPRAFSVPEDRTPGKDNVQHETHRYLSHGGVYDRGDSPVL